MHTGDSHDFNDDTSRTTLEVITHNILTYEFFMDSTWNLFENDLIIVCMNVFSLTRVEAISWVRSEAMPSKAQQVRTYIH